MLSKTGKSSPAPNTSLPSTNLQAVEQKCRLPSATHPGFLNPSTSAKWWSQDTVHGEHGTDPGWLLFLFWLFTERLRSTCHSTHTSSPKILLTALERRDVILPILQRWESQSIERLRHLPVIIKLAKAKSAASRSSVGPKTFLNRNTSGVLVSYRPRL